MASTSAFDPDAGSFDAWLDAVAAAGPPELLGPDPAAAAVLDERLAAELDLLDVRETGGAAGLVARVADVRPRCRWGRWSGCWWRWTRTGWTGPGGWI
jgi:hypothetical protein